MKKMVLLLIVAVLACIVMVQIAGADDGPMSYAYIVKTETPTLWYACLVHHYYGTIKRVPCYGKGDAIMVVKMMSERWNIPYYIHHEVDGKGGD